MAKNSARRTFLLDAALAVLAHEGGRGLTHRATDAQAGVPVGTCVNYFRSRDALLGAMAERIFERLTPSSVALAESASKKPSRARVAELMHELMERVHAEPDLQLALLELRLESTRRADLAAMLTRTLEDALQLDVAFHKQAGLPGGRESVLLLHLAFEGLILNTLTVPDVLKVAQRADVVEALVARLVPTDS